VVIFSPFGEQTMNFLQCYEKNILKVIEWAHRKNVAIEDITKEEIIHALHVFLRDPSHS